MLSDQEPWHLNISPATCTPATRGFDTGMAQYVKYLSPFVWQDMLLKRGIISRPRWYLLAQIRMGEFYDRSLLAHDSSLGPNIATPHAALSIV
jgi:hypothetical protein